MDSVGWLCGGGLLSVVIVVVGGGAGSVLVVCGLGFALPLFFFAVVGLRWCWWFRVLAAGMLLLLLSSSVVVMVLVLLLLLRNSRGGDYRHWSSTTTAPAPSGTDRTCVLNMKKNEGGVHLGTVSPDIIEPNLEL